MGFLDGTAPDSRICSVTTGLVKENWDQDHPGMLKLEYFLGTTGKNVTGWVPVAMPYAFKDCGSYMLPEVGSEVVIAFNMGDRNCPIVIGCLWNQKNTLMQETANEKNTIKRFLTKGGNEVRIDDEGGKQSIEIHTPKELHLKIEDENETIELLDKDKKSGLTIKVKEGEVHLSAKSKLILEVDGTPAITIDGGAKKMQLEMSQIQIEAAQTLKAKGQTAQAEATTMELKAQSSLKVQSGAVAEIKGALVKVN